MNVKCEKCQGGRQYYQEDGRNVSDVCYRCGGSGWVDEETAHHTKMEQVALHLADAYVREYRKACDNDPEGEGWVFRAAENMMSAEDYTKGMVYDKQCEFGEELAHLPRSLQSALIYAICPTKEEKPGKTLGEVMKDIGVAMPTSDDDIPF